MMNNPRLTKPEPTPRWYLEQPPEISYTRQVNGRRQMFSAFDDRYSVTVDDGTTATMTIKLTAYVPKNAPVPDLAHVSRLIIDALKDVP